MKKLLKTISLLIFSGIVGFAVAFLLIDQGVAAIQLFLLLPIAFIAVYFHIIIHEGGHLVAGKLSGYKFISFRVGKFTIVRTKDGKLAYKKYQVSGTGGQCLMSPPDALAPNYRFPFIFYNMGGGLANLIFSMPFIPLLFATSGILHMILWIFVAVGVLLGLINIIPIAAMLNDGHNALSAKKNTDSRRAFWLQLRYVDLLSKGVRVRDMPAEWFENIPVEFNSSTGVLIAMRHSYLLDNGEFAQAKEFAQQIIDGIEGTDKLHAIHKNELIAELPFFELISECRAEELEKLYTDELKAHIEAHKILPSKQRILYAYELLHNKDAEKAGEALVAFEKACLTTPFEGELHFEREMIALVQEKAAMAAGE